MIGRSSDVVRSFWYGTELSPYEVLCLKSFVDHGHSVELYAYDRDLVVPAGVRLCDASEVLAKDKVFFYASGPGKGSVAGFSNLFRYSLLLCKGGWWVDTDVICLSSHLPSLDRFFAWEDHDEVVVGCAVVKLPPNDRILVECLSQISAFRADAPWGTTGPFLLTATVRALDLTSEVQPFETAYPWHHSRSIEVLDPQQADVISMATSNATCHHLWHENFRRCGISKLIRPPAGSYLDLLFRRHDVEFPAQPAYDYGALVRANAVYRQ